jgi:hypothetical protein
MVTLEVYDRRWKKWRKVAESKTFDGFRIANYTEEGLTILSLASDAVVKLFFGRFFDALARKTFVPNMNQVSEQQIIDHENPETEVVPLDRPLHMRIRFTKNGNPQRIRFLRTDEPTPA